MRVLFDGKTNNNYIACVAAIKHLRHRKTGSPFWFDVHLIGGGPAHWIAGAGVAVVRKYVIRRLYIPAQAPGRHARAIHFRQVVASVTTSAPQAL